jgi:sugar lactone lactonase YvrE
MKIYMSKPIELKNATTLILKTSLTLCVIAAVLMPIGTYAVPGDLFASINHDAQTGAGSIYQYTPPSGTPSTFESGGLPQPRGMVFDSAGNLFVASNAFESSGNTQGTIFRIDANGNTITPFATVFPDNFFLEALVIDSAGNIFVAAQDSNDTNLASTIYKVAPDGTVVSPPFASIPGQGIALAFDSVGNLYAVDHTFQIIWKFNPTGAVYQPTPTGTPGVFADQTAFSPSHVPVTQPFFPPAPDGLAFDAFGNLFVSVDDGTSGDGAILKFAPDGSTETTIATGLSDYLRGLAFDAAGNLFAAEIAFTEPGDILEFNAGNSTPTVFASGIGRASGNGGPEFLAFVPGSNTLTPVGSNVTTNAGTVSFATIALTFPEVSSAGTTTVIPVNPSSAGYTLPGTSLAFDITTTAAYPTPVPTPPGIVIAFHVAPPLDASQLTVFHNEGGTLVNVTCPSPRPGPTPDTTTNTIYASVTSLSPFVIAKVPFAGHVQQPINSDGSSVFNANRGVVPVKFTLTQDGVATCTLPVATIAVTRTAGGTIGAVDESLYNGAADTGSYFRSGNCQYVYNLNSGALGAGTYRVDIKVGGIVVGSARFGLK